MVVMADAPTPPLGTSREQRELFELLQSAVRCGVWTFTPYTNVMQWTEPVYEIFGVPMGRFAGTSDAFLELVHPDDRAAVAKAISDAQGVRVAGIVTAQHRIVLPNGSIRWIAQHIRAYRDPVTDAVVRLFGIVADLTEELHAKEEQRITAERYTVLSEFAADAIFILDHEGIVQYINRAAAQWLGRQYHQIVGKKVSDLFDPETVRHQWASIQKVFTTSESVLIEALNTFEGNQRFLSTRLSPIRNNEGAVVAVLGVARDITEQRAAVEMLRSSEERYRIAAQHTGQILYDWNIPGGSLTWEGSIQDVTGYDPAEFPAGTIDEWSGLIHPEDRTAALAILEKAKSSGEQYHAIYRFRHKDGSYAIMEDNGSFLKDGQGNVNRMIGSMKDVSEYATAINHLQEAERIGHFGSYDFNARSECWVSSPSLDEIFGIGPDYERTTEGWGALIHPDDRKDMLDYFRTEVLGHKKPFDREYRIIRKSGGETRILHGWGRLDIDSQGNVKSMLGIIQDVTELRAAQRAQARTSELERINAVMMDREQQMIKLKERIRELEQQLTQKR